MSTVKRIPATLGLLLLALLLAASPLIILQHVVFSVEAATSTDVFSSVTAENSWVSKASMLSQRVGFRVAVVNGKIYAIGGMVGGADLHWVNTVEEYDTATDTWTTKTSMPTARAYFGIATYQNKIYAVGGQIGSNSETDVSILCDVNEVYDPSTDTWETKTPMPTERKGLCASVVDGKIYLIGGESTRTSLYVPMNITRVNEVYDPATDSWVTKTPLPQNASRCSSVTLDNKIYVISKSHNQIYDVATDSWSMGSYLPESRYSAGVAATTGLLAPKRIYVMGGQMGSYIEVANSNYVYDPEKNVWGSGAPLPTARAGVVIAVVDDLLYVMGGVENLMGPPSEYLTQNLQYTPLGYGTIPPVVSVVSPGQNKTYASSNVSLTFTVNRPTLGMVYSLDGQMKVAVTENITLTGLANGLHNLTIYATDKFGNSAVPETVIFTVAEEQQQHETESFPTTTVAVSAATVGIISVSLVAYYFTRTKKNKQANQKN